MGLTSKKLISDQVLYVLSGGRPDSGFPVDERDIWKAIDQKINAQFKLHQFDNTLPSGETIPENTMIATYDGVAVTATSNGKSFSLLPIIPISLPKSVGIFLVYDINFPDRPFVPLQRGQSFLLKADSLLSNMMGQISYEPKNNQIVYNTDITLLGIKSVTMELCVFDITQYSITDYLPVPSDYEERIVKELLAEFTPVNAESGQVNNFTTSGQNQIVK